MIVEYFWWLLTMACVVWYFTVTIYVAVKGSIDIKEMLTRLSDTSNDRPDSPGGAS